MLLIYSHTHTHTHTHAHAHARTRTHTHTHTHTHTRTHAHTRTRTHTHTHTTHTHTHHTHAHLPSSSVQGDWQPWSSVDGAWGYFSRDSVNAPAGSAWTGDWFRDAMRDAAGGGDHDGWECVPPVLAHCVVCLLAPPLSCCTTLCLLATLVLLVYRDHEWL
jgi:hypothetical protein